MRKGLKIFLIILAVIIALVAAGAIFLTQSTKTLENIADVPIEITDVSALPNGTYEGRYKAFPISVVVEVTVHDGKFAGIKLVKHFNGQGQAADAIPDLVIAAQSLKIDMVSGATSSSKVILLAIEDALKNASGT